MAARPPVSPIRPAAARPSSNQPVEACPLYAARVTRVLEPVRKLALVLLAVFEPVETLAVAASERLVRGAQRLMRR